MQRANRVRKLRDEKRWTGQALADKIGVSKETISKIERRVQGITEPQAHALANVFGISIDDLYEAGPEPVRGLAEEATPFEPDAGSFEARIPLEEHQSWYILKHSHLDQIGYFDNMPVVIDVSKERMADLHIGDVVICNKYHASGKGAETIARQFVPPSILITNSFRNNLPILNLNSDAVVILGIVVHPRPRRIDPPRR